MLTIRYDINYVLLILIMISGCGGSESDANTAHNLPSKEYSCGTLVANETCISLDMPDNYSQQRHFILNTPENLAQSPPLFIVLHGSGGRADNTVERFLFRDFIEQHKLIGVFPNAIIREDGISTWNAHDDTYRISYIDDVSFIKAVINKVVTDQQANIEKVFIFGWSNGGFMANRLACEIPEYISAIYTLAGNLRGELNSCKLAGNVAVHHLHATGDIIVPFSGDQSKGYFSAEDAINRWVEFNRCDLTPLTIDTFDLTRDELGKESRSYLFQNCNAATEFTVIAGSNHAPDFHTDVLHQKLLEFYQKSVP